MSSDGVSPSSSGPGNGPRACLTCARAKAKCVLGEEYGGKCQRCHRLQKHCEPAPTRERAQPRKRKATDSTRIAKHRIEKLEEKLDGLVTLLKSNQENGINGGSATPLGSQPITISTPSYVRNTPDATVSNHNIDPEYSQAISRTVDGMRNGVGVPKEISCQNVHNGVACTPSLPVLPRILPKTPKPLEDSERWDDRLFNGGRPRARFGLPPVGSREADGLGMPIRPPPPKFELGHIDFGHENPEVCLDIFRHEMNPNFPFISLPDTISAEELRQESPTLFTAIMAVTSRVTAQQKRLGKMVMEQVGQRMLVNEERNMDLLLGVLTYAGWCYFHFYNIPHLTALVASAMTLVSDLRLTRPEKFAGPDEIALAFQKSMGRDTSDPPPRTIEERRAFLGYCFLNSTVSQFFRRLEGVKWTPYVEECCNVLCNTGAHRDDVAAVALIKMQIIAETISLSPWHQRADGQDRPQSAPPVLYISALKEQIKGIQTEFGPTIENNGCVLLNYLSLNVSLYKIGLSKTSRLSNYPAREFNRLEYLYTCFESVKTFNENFFAIPDNMMHTMSITMLSLFTQNHGILQLLSTFEHPDWNLAYVKDTVSFLEILDRISKRFGRAKFALNLDPHTSEGLDLFSQSARKAAWMKSYFESKYIGQQNGLSEIECPAREIPEYPTGLEPMEFIDDAWVQNFLGSWEQQISW